MTFHPTRFWNRMAKGYARKPVKDQAAYQYKLESTARLLSADDHLLEFGCGTGSTALYHAPNVARIDAIDFSSEMIAIAREKAAAEGIGNVQFDVASIEEWPVGQKTYDAVLGMSVLHLVADLDAVLCQVNHALKPGGRFFSSTVCLGDMGGMMRFVLPPLGALGILPKLRWLTPESLTDHLTAHGFIVEKVWRPAAGAAVYIVAQKSA